MSRIRQIIQEYFHNTYPKIVRRQFSAWLLDSRSAEEKDHALREIWDGLRIAPGQCTEQSFRQVQRRLSAGRPSRRMLLFRKTRTAAAILLLPLFLSAAVYFYVKSAAPAGHSRLVECFVPNGQTQTIFLPDSSKVVLNAGSVLIYPQEFSAKNRTVYLNGKACFTVTRKERQPFIVKTTDMDIEVLGTVFDVSSYADSEHASATLQSGRVSVRLKNETAESIFLSPDEQILYDRLSGSVQITRVNAAHALAWQNGHLALQGIPMNEITKILERRYGLTVFLNAHKYEDEKITAKFLHGESLHDLLAVLQQLIPSMKYKIEENKLYIY